jgi:hypothetical protein
MQSKKLVRAGCAAALLTLLFICGWELYWRNRGFVPTFNDDRALWVESRRKAVLPMHEATVFVGSSRIKFDLDIPTWEAETGEQAVQLALVGTSPRLLLQDLAGDPEFRGKVVVDVTEVLFFSSNPAFHRSAKEATAYYRDQTLSERWSARTGMALESQLAFLEERRFSLNTLLQDLALPNRAGVFVVPPFPKGFEWTNADRQTYMSAAFLADTSLLRRQTRIWQTLIMGDPTPPVTGEALQAIFDEVASAVHAIEARGGKVIFVRTPSSGPMAIGEEKAYPRRIYWEGLLRATGAKGIHYLDDRKTAGLECPEWSHLAPADALRYTRQLILQLREAGWFSMSR